jgi:hypothetical protein
VIQPPATFGRLRRRLLHRLWAALLGYFWLPCPACRKPFGGHEWRDLAGRSATVYLDPDQPAIGTGICPACTVTGWGMWPWETPWWTGPTFVGWGRVD